MPEIGLTGADLADIAAGLRFNTIDSDGNEVLLDGIEFSTDEIKALSEGKQIYYEVDGTLYGITAPDEAWAGHRTPVETQELQEGR